MARLARLARVIPGFVAGALGVRYVAGRLRDEQNIRRLAAHEGCSIAEARQLYAIARREGYGAAQRAVFGSEPGSDERIASRPSRPAP